MQNYSKIVILIIVILSLTGIDQFTKSIAKERLQFSPPSEYIGGVVQLQYAENEGGFLSFGADMPLIIRQTVTIVLTFVLVGGLFVLLTYSNKVYWGDLISYALLISGGAGNLIDRLFNGGKVIDFLVVGTEKIHTGIFNVADFFLMTGLAVLLLNQFFHSRNSSQQAPPDTQKNAEQ